MGGIKNKLKQLSDKVANLVFSARLGSSVRRSLLDGVDNKTFNLASTARGGGLRSKPVGLLSITKHASIACFTLALISTIGLNLYKTYSNSSIETSAIGSSNNGEPAIQADIDPTSISLSITSSPSSSTGGNNPNLSLSIPQGGGIATGRHTVRVDAGSDIGSYDLYLSSDSDETGLVNSEDTNTDTNTIPTTTGTIDNPSTLADKTYGYTLTDLDNNSNLTSTPIWVGLQPNANPATIATIDDSDLALGQANTTTHNIYYGAKVKHPEQLLAGDYTADVVYTVVAELMPAPEVTDLVLNSSYIPYTTSYSSDLGDSPEDTAYGITSILTGQNLSTITTAWVDMNDNEAMDSGEEVVNLIHATGNEANTKLTFEAPEAPRQSIGDQFPEGTHDVYIEWGGGDPVKIENGWNYIKQSECLTVTSTLDTRQSDCIVDIDDNMIPVYYTGDENSPEWSLVADCTDVTGSRQCSSMGSVNKENMNWYDYSAGRWANAVTLRDDMKAGCYTLRQLDIDRIDDPAICQSTANVLTPLQMAKQVALTLGDNVYSGDPIYVNGEILQNMPLHPDDILGYWVYIPRYSYEVMRRDAIDLVQQPEDFKIKFETADTTKKVPVEGCSDTNDPMSYRVGCSLNRTYTNTATDTSTNEVANTTWATHPAFTWMDEDGNPIELNGIWVGKFETTGSTEEPTVLPNEKHMSLVSGNIGDMYDVAKSMGIEDKNNKYGNTTSTNLPNQNNNHLATSTSHMLKNSEWGAVAYLSASRYGVGVNNVQINANASSGNDGNDDSSYGITGCGPNGSSQYNTENGQLASTTNNIYGVYDMAGGAYEYVMGSYTNDSTQSYPSNGYITNKVKPPYVDLYVNPPFNGNEGTNNNLCTWTTCGGHALFETAGWGDDYFYFVHSSNPWFLRGGYANADSAGTGVFYSGVSNGRTLGSNSFRVGLAALSAM